MFRVVFVKYDSVMGSSYDLGITLCSDKSIDKVRILADNKIKELKEKHSINNVSYMVSSN